MNILEKKLEKKLTLYGIQKTVDWGKVKRLIPKEVIDEHLSEIEIKMYLKLLVIFYNFKKEITLNSFFYETIKGNSKSAMRYKTFSAPYEEISKRKFETLEDFHQFVEENNLSKEFKLDGNLLKEEQTDYHNVFNSNIEIGLI